MRVAVIQMQCDDTGNKEANMKTIAKLLEKELLSNGDGESNDGTFPPPRPKVVLAPEFAICGYTYEYETMWKAAEKVCGI